MPMAKERIGGTARVLEKSDEARRIVPSPPKVATRSVFWRILPAEGALVSTAKTFCVADLFLRREASVGSARKEMRGYVDATCLRAVSYCVPMSMCGDLLSELDNGILSGRGSFFLEKEDILERRGPAKRQQIILLSLCECQTKGLKMGCSLATHGDKMEMSDVAGQVCLQEGGYGEWMRNCGSAAGQKVFV